MLKVLYQKLRLKCKGSLDHNNYSNLSKLQIGKVGKLDSIGKHIVQGIPVLSIFALVGIVNYIVNPELENIRFFPKQTCLAADCGRPDVCPAGYEWRKDEGEACESCKPLSTTAPSDGEASSSLVIDNNIIRDKINATYGTTNYTSHKININAENIAGYALTITGPATISTQDTNGNSVTGATTLSGAGGKTPTTMANNSWGYAWGTDSTADSSLTYNSFTGIAQTLENSISLSNNQVSLTKKLVFAAKFSDDAKDGHYKATVSLNLTTTPAQLVTWKEMVYLQDMSAATCASANIGATTTLKDIRDNNSYTVAKLSDGNCWMTQNLRLAGGTLLGPDNTDLDRSIFPGSIIDGGVYGTYKLPAAITAGFNNTQTADKNGVNTYMSQQVRNSVNNDYGAYYSWCAATAGTCQQGAFYDIQPSGSYGVAINPTKTTAIPAGADASSSICPKGWKLPKGDTTTANNNSASQTGNDFANAFGYTGTLSSNPNIYPSLGSPSFSNGFTINNIKWYAAGYVDTNGLRDTGSYGVYWSRSAGDATRAYFLNFNSSTINPAYNGLRYLGYSVRCVAYSS